MTGGAEDSPATREYATIRDLVGRLSELADELDDGMDTRFELGICDGSGVRIVDDADLDQYQVVSTKDAVYTGQFVMLRAHVHPGEAQGRYMPGIAESADRELRKLTEGDDA